MSKGTDEERAIMALEFRIERTKRIRRQLDDVVRFWLEGLSVTLIAKRLNTDRHRVYFLLRVLELRNGNFKRPPRPGHQYGLEVPRIDAAGAS